MKKISRRVFLARGAALGAAVGVTVIALPGCGGEEALSCTDTAGLTPAEQSTRTNLAYVDVSPEGTEKNCDNCNFFTSAGEAACGTCTLLKGGIHPLGYCNSWVVKA